MKQRIVLLLIAVVAVSAWPAFASAHEYKDSHGISAVFHVEPSHHPKANEKATFYLSFADKNKRFNLQDCDCTLSVQKDGKTLKRLVLDPQLEGATKRATTSYTFLQEGTYDLLVAGHDRNHQFTDFDLDFDVEVQGDAKAVAHTKNILPIVLVAGVLAIGSVLGWGALRDRRNA